METAFCDCVLQLDRAKLLLTQDPSFKSGFKFDHVWPILKDIEKYVDSSNRSTPSHKK